MTNTGRKVFRAVWLLLADALRTGQQSASGDELFRKVDSTPKSLRGTPLFSRATLASIEDDTVACMEVASRISADVKVVD